MIRCSSSGNSGNEKPISRFPVPELSSVPDDLREMMEETLKKVMQSLLFVFDLLPRLTEVISQKDLCYNNILSIELHIDITLLFLQNATNT